MSSSIRRWQMTSGLAILLSLGIGLGAAAQTAPATSATEATTLDDLPGMILSESDLAAELAGFVLSEASSVPNEVLANTGGDGEPVTLDDPEYGDELARLNGWGRLGGYEVTFTREAELGEPHEVEVSLELAESAEGAHEFYAGWFGSEPDGCLGVGDESDCPSGIGLLLREADGSEQLLSSRSATFRAGRLIGDVSVWARSDPDADPGPELEALATRLAQRLFERVEAGPTTSPHPSPTSAEEDGTGAPAPDAMAPRSLDAGVLEGLCRQNAPDRRTRARCLEIVRTVLAPDGAIVIPAEDETDQSEG